MAQRDPPDEALGRRHGRGHRGLGHRRRSPRAAPGADAEALGRRGSASAGSVRPWHRGRQPARRQPARRRCRRSHPGRDAAVRAHRAAAALVWRQRARAGHDRGVRLAPRAGCAGRERVGDGAPVARARRIAAGAPALGRARRRSGRERRSRRAARGVPGVAAGRAGRRRARAALLDAGLGEIHARAAGRSRGAGGRHQGRRVERRPDERGDRADPVRHVVRDAPRDRRRGDGVGDAPRLVGERGRERPRAQRHAARQRRPSAATGVQAGSTYGAPCARRGFRIRTSRTTGARPRSANGPCTRVRSSSRASATRATGSTSTRSTCPRAGRPGPACARAGRA